MKINFEKMQGLVPCVIQDYYTNKVLMLGFMNEEAYLQTKKTDRVTFFSRTKNRIWVKGETSGNFLTVKEILLDCDGDTLLIKAIPTGPVCHKGNDTCFGDVNQNIGLDFLEAIIESRKNESLSKSYTSELFKKGLNAIAQKVGEEAVELIIASKDNDTELFLNEASDLLFHYLVLLSAKDKSLQDVVEVLKSRNRAKN